MSVPTISYAARSLRLRLPKVVVSIAASDPANLETKAEQALREGNFLEFRLDYQKNPQLAIQRIKRLMDYRPDMIAIATCRRKQAGGNFSGSLASQLEILQKASDAGCQIVDLELESAEAVKAAEFESFRANISTLLVSYHDYKATKKLDETLERMVQFNADFYKLIGTATCLHDNVVMMQFLQKHSDQHFMIGHCMGEQGIISRVLGVRAGSVFTFGSVGDGEETAPGQVSMRELRDLYRIEHVDAVTKVYGVVGDPISHSLSPYIMNAALRRENVKAVYLRLHAKKLDDLMACMNEIPVHGLSVTMPYKQEIVPHLQNSDVWTKRAGACNTVVRGQDGRLFGFNTDVAGIITPLEDHVTLQGAKVLVLGAGGAARAAVFGLQQRGAEVSILNRTPQRAAALAKESGAKVIKRSDLAKMDFDAIINATSVGLGNQKHSPLEANELRTKVVFDLIYNPYETKLLKIAREKQLIAISGVEMFVQQAARQFEIWTGFPAPLDEMRQVVFLQLGEKPIPATPAGQRAAALAAAKAEQQELAKYETGPAQPMPANGTKAEVKPAVKTLGKAVAVKTTLKNSTTKVVTAIKSPAKTATSKAVTVAKAKNNGKPVAKAPARVVVAKAKPKPVVKKTAVKKPAKPLSKAKKR